MSVMEANTRRQMLQAQETLRQVTLEKERFEATIQTQESSLRIAQAHAKELESRLAQARRDMELERETV